MKQMEIKKKLRVLQSPGINWVIVDILREVSKESGEEGVTDIEYAVAAKEIIRRIRDKYKTELLPEVKIYNRDLEELIQSIKDGKE